MSEYDRQLLAHLLTFLTPQRRERFGEVLAMRTRRLAVVLEDVHSPHNIAAVLRSCDAFGVQDVHVVETHNTYEPPSSVAMGSEQWLTVHQYTDAPEAPRACIDHLCRQGYRIVVAAPHAEGATPETLEIDEPCAVVFGAEKDGVTPWMQSQADTLLTIPMCGFVESFNISVAAAICLRGLSSRIRAARANWKLSTEEREELLLAWSRLSVPNVESIERRFREQSSASASES